MRVCYYNITFRCNERCVFCAADSQAGSKEASFFQEGELSKDQFAESLEKIGVDKDDEIRISGGEPTLHSDFMDILAIACNRAGSVWVSTTATYFADKSRLETLDHRHHCFFDVRLYAHLPEIHDKLTRIAGSFGRTVKGLKNLSAFRREQQLDYGVGVRLLLARQTLPYLTDTGLLAIRELEIDSVCVNMLIESKSTHRSSAFFPMKAAQREIDRLFRAMKGDGRLNLSCLPVCILPHELAEAEFSRYRSGWGKDAEAKGMTFYIHTSLGRLRSMKFKSKREELGNTTTNTCVACDAYDFCVGMPEWYWDKYGEKESLGLTISSGEEKTIHTDSGGIEEATS